MNGLNQPSSALFDRLLAKYQLVAIQETKFSKPDHLQSATYFAHTADAHARCFWSHQSTPTYNGRHGVGLVAASSSPLQDLSDVSSSVLSPALSNRYLLLRSKLHNNDLFIHVVYAPDEPALRSAYFQALPTDFPATASHLVLGDFNVTLDSRLDQISNSHHGSVGRADLQCWLTTIGLLDAWRFTNPDVCEYTSPTRRNRLDFCFLSLDLLQNNLEEVSHVYNEKWHHEDHAPVHVHLSARRLPRNNKSPWRCPPWLLAVPAVREHLEKTARSLAGRIRLFAGDNPGCLLDEHKRSDCIYLKEQLKTLRHADQKHMQELLQRVQDAQDQVNIRQTQANQALLQQRRLAVQAHQDLLQQRNQYKKFAHDLYQSEKPTSSFFRAPVPDRLRVPIVDTRLPDGSVTSDANETAAAHRDYWGKLFQSTSADLRQHRDATYQPFQLLELLQFTTAKVSPVQKAALDAPFTANDFYWAIATSKKNKAPGPDGLPVEYYQIDPHLWAQIYDVVYSSQLRKKRMTKFQRRAHLSLLYKSGDRSLPSNYRPLTLLNHDAKFGPKILAYRLREVLQSLIHDDQTGFIHGRSIRHSLLRFQDLQHLAKQGHPDAVAILLDFAKAFDSVLWPALELVLRHYGFGATFCDWIKTFYNGTSVSILLNNVPGRPFELGAGVRQGDPLSPALFILFIEPMLNYLRSCCGNAGLPCSTSTQRHLLLAFADDCTGILEDVESARAFLTHVKKYADAAGMRLNEAKTCVLPLSPAIDPSKLEDLRSSTSVKVLRLGETVKLLGVHQGTDITPDARFSPLLDQMRTRCVLWKYRARTLRGRTAILRSIILPLLWYTASVSETPQWVITATDVIIRNFVNQRAPSTTAAPGLLNKDWIYASVKNGGLGLTHPKDFIQATHLVCLRDAIRCGSAGPAATRWCEPALVTFSRALQGAGVGFDALYAVLPRTRPHTSPWMAVTDFWFETLVKWSQLDDGSSNWQAHAQDLPFWNNRRLVFGSTRRPILKLSTHAQLLVDCDRLRLDDFLRLDGCFPTPTTISAILDDARFPRPASKTRFVNDFCARLNVLIPELGPVEGPHFPALLASATHGWKLSGKAVISMTNYDFVKILRSRHIARAVPYEQLQVPDSAADAIDWLKEHALDRHVLPVCADVKFRAQRNSLGFRYKFQWRTSVTTTGKCIHGCEALETGEHLFWSCPIADYQWRRYLPLFETILDRCVRWHHALFPSTLQLSAHGLRTYGPAATLHVFNIIRCCVFRGLWLHRNKKLYNPDVSSSREYVLHHIQAYVRLHLRTLATHAQTQGIPRLQLLLTYISTRLAPQGDHGPS